MHAACTPHEHGTLHGSHLPRRDPAFLRARLHRAQLLWRMSEDRAAAAELGSVLEVFAPTSAGVETARTRFVAFLFRALILLDCHQFGAALVRATPILTPTLTLTPTLAPTPTLTLTLAPAPTLALTRPTCGRRRSCASHRSLSGSCASPRVAVCCRWATLSRRGAT